MQILSSDTIYPRITVTFVTLVHHTLSYLEEEIEYQSNKHKINTERLVDLCLFVCCEFTNLFIK